MKPKKQKLQCEKCGEKREIEKFFLPKGYHFFVNSYRFKKPKYISPITKNDRYVYRCIKCDLKSIWIEPVKKEGKKHD